MLLCLASPPCLLALGMVVGASFIAVQIFVHAAQSSTTKPWAGPITTTMPPVAPADEEDDPCMALQIECLENKRQPAWNVKDFGPEKNCKDCYRECKFHSKPRGTWPDYKCPRN